MNQVDMKQPLTSSSSEAMGEGLLFKACAQKSLGLE
jgi:hypothetical protein